LIATPVALSIDNMKIQVHVYLTDRYASARVVYTTAVLNSISLETSGECLCRLKNWRDTVNEL
jgi:hypothetical protein